MLAITPYSGAVLRDTLAGNTWEEWPDQLHGELGLSKPQKA